MGQKNENNDYYLANKWKDCLFKKIFVALTINFKLFLITFEEESRSKSSLKYFIYDMDCFISLKKVYIFTKSSKKFLLSISVL